jgi:hypothetical protein
MIPLLVVFAVFAFVMSGLIMIDAHSQPPKKECEKTHAWSYHPLTKRLTCTDCDKVAGD